MSHKTFTAELPKPLIDYVTAYGSMQATCQSYALELVQSEMSVTKQRQLLQQHGFNKRQAASLLTDVEGKWKSSIECYELHVETLEGKISSAEKQIAKWEKQLAKLKYPCCSIRRNQWKTEQHRLRFKLHHKRRYLAHQQRRLTKLEAKPLSINFGPTNNFIFVGSQGESGGNQICQYDGERIKIRLPEALEPVFGGKTIEAPLTFKYGQDCINAALGCYSITRTGNLIKPGKGAALTWRFYQKRDRWYVAVTVDVTDVPNQSQPTQYGCLGIDFNPGVIGWCLTDDSGNPIRHGQFKVNLHSRRSGQVEAELADVAAKIVSIAEEHACPIVIERLDFSAKKKRMREESRRYARMLNAFAYSTWKDLLSARCNNRGVQLINVNPAYSSLIGLTKFMRLYGLSSDTAAALVLARRAMRLSESVPLQYAQLVVMTRRHVWSAWNRLNRKLKGLRRHSFFQPKLTAIGSDVLARETENSVRADRQGSGNSVPSVGEIPIGDPDIAVSVRCLDKSTFG